MTPLKITTIGLIVGLLGELAYALDVRQDPMFISVGDSVTLTCSHNLSGLTVVLSWYKQTLGHKPQLISSSFKYINLNGTFYNEFKDNPRFSVHIASNKLHLRMSDVQLSDSATYYCSSSSSNQMDFAEEAILNVKGSGIKYTVQQPASLSVQLGDSVILNCTIHTETCPGEHSIYWFKYGSGESRPGILYTHGGRSDQCEKSPEAGSPTQSCVYNLPKRNLSLSDAGTYHCAVASCGDIVYGEGTKLDIKLVGEDQMRMLVLLSIIRTGVLLCCLFIVIIFCFIKKSS
ncbi:signal-regulatory protein beta-2-like [Osmerus mordax]|uniref:signal-regulatory protein beta-2-like n=1 Tax=Osmerus mordax TaxID=8014 RepID=UPI00350F0CFD